MAPPTLSAAIMSAREENIFLARLAEQAERWEDMVEYMKRVAVMGSALNNDERNLLSMAYKKYVSARRHAFRQMSVMEADTSRGPEVQQLIRDYIVKVEGEMNEKCKDILQLLSTQLIPKATDTEDKVFYLKLQGDYHRYVAEFAKGAQKEEAVQSAQTSYQDAFDAATPELPPTDPLRLGLVLNFSVFYYEVLSSPVKACQLAKAAFDEAKAGFDALPEEKQAAIQEILPLLRENLNLWNSMQSNEDGKPPELDGTAVEDL